MISYHLNTRSVTSSLLASVFCVPLMALSTPAVAELLPHRAVYELSLLDAERDSGIDNASGLFVFQVTGSSCAGWNMHSSMALSVLNHVGNALQTDTDYQAFETSDGAMFTYESNTRTTGEASNMVTGAAERVESGGLSMRRLNDDEGTATASVGTLFPNQLTQALLDSARDGQALLFFDVFDGSHSSGQAQAVTAVIGEQTRPSVIAPIPSENRGNDEEITGAATSDGQEIWTDFDTPVAAWPVLLSYFDPLEPDSTPSFQVSYLLDSNGVSDDVVLDYGSFSLRGVLSDFSPFRPTSCSD